MREDFISVVAEMLDKTNRYLEKYRPGDFVYSISEHYYCKVISVVPAEYRIRSGLFDRRVVVKVKPELILEPFAYLSFNFTPWRVFSEKGKPRYNFLKLHLEEEKAGIWPWFSVQYDFDFKKNLKKNYRLDEILPRSLLDPKIVDLQTMEQVLLEVQQNEQIAEQRAAEALRRERQLEQQHERERVSEEGMRRRAAIEELIKKL